VNVGVISRNDREVDYGEEIEEIEVEDQEGKARQEGRCREEEEKVSEAGGAEEEGRQEGCQEGEAEEARCAQAGSHAVDRTSARTRPCRAVMDDAEQQRRQRARLITSREIGRARPWLRALPRELGFFAKVGHRDKVVHCL